jgi:hypothetical protein
VSDFGWGTWTFIIVIGVFVWGSIIISWLRK